MRITALLTSHDRRDSTVACLRALEEQQRDAGVWIDAVLVDAGSRDGTAESVRDGFPWVEVVRRGPELFWNGGMREAWTVARRRTPDAYLWLNDDTLLDPDAVQRLVRLHRTEPGAIVVGATRDPVTGRLTYSGVHRPSRWRPLSFPRVVPQASPRRVETMNGNCVLVPEAVAELVGNLDPGFTHGMGDFDYGLRARERGVEIVLAPGTVGTCAANDGRPDRTVGEEIAHLRGAKGLPPAEWLRFARRWAGPAWPVYFASPYVRRVGARLLGRRTP